MECYLQVTCSTCIKVQPDVKLISVFFTLGVSGMRIKSFGSALIALLLCLPAFAQTLGEISGAVRDSTGAAIPAAQITVTNVDTNATRSAVSNEVGYYTFPALPPGTYNLKAEKVGFKTVNSARYPYSGTTERSHRRGVAGWFGE